jgi:hypothetical protein
LAFHACASDIPAIGIEGPSGHARFSAVFYGCLALFGAAGRPLWQRTGIYAGTALFVLFVSVSRFFVEAHTLPRRRRMSREVLRKEGVSLFPFR